MASCGSSTSESGFGCFTVSHLFHPFLLALAVLVVFVVFLLVFGLFLFCCVLQVLGGCFVHSSECSR